MFQLLLLDRSQLVSRRRQVACFLVILVGITARISWEAIDPLKYWDAKAWIYFRDCSTLGIAALVVLGIAVSKARSRSSDRCLPAWFDSRGRQVALATAFVTTVACSLIAKYGLLAVPHVVDEAAYLWQAKLLAAGHLTAPADPLGHATSIEYVADFAGKRFSAFFPGSAVPLAVGEWLHVTTFVDPVLAGLLTLEAFWALKRLFDERIATLSMPLMALSPFVLFQGASFFSHVWTAMFTLAAFSFGVSPRRRSDPLVVGTCVGIAMMSRPVSAAVVGLVITALWIWRSRSKSAPIGTSPWRALLGARRQLCSAAIGGLPWVLVFAAVNHELTGSWFETAHRLLLPQESLQLGMTAVKNLSINLVGLAVDLTGLPLAGGVLAVVGLVRLYRGPHKANAVAVGGYAAAQLLVYAAYYNNGVSYGPRYQFETAPLLIGLAAAGLLGLFRRRVLAILAFCVAATSLFATIPTRLAVFHPRGQSVDLRYTQVLEKAPAKSLVLLGAGAHDIPDTFWPAFVHNQPERSGTSPKVLFIRAGEGRYCSVRALFPARSTFYAEHGKLSPAPPCIAGRAAES